MKYTVYLDRHQFLEREVEAISPHEAVEHVAYVNPDFHVKSVEDGEVALDVIGQCEGCCDYILDDDAYRSYADGVIVCDDCEREDQE